MRVALFGGSFNPPHVAHQLVALYVLETAPVDALWLVPAYEHAFGKPLAPFEDRLAMCELAAAALGPRAQVSDVERAIGGRSLTLQTVRRLRELHPAHAFSLVIGSDVLRDVASWYGGDELARSIPFIVVGRPDAESAPDGAVSPAVTMPDVSSTVVRAALAAGKPAEGLVPRAVLDYIRRKGLYQGLA
jgi:nicotinate-nucleotide adenylyltransferase